VKFIQLYHQGWDQHDNLPRDIEQQCRETDQASAALVTDLKRRGLLDDTLVVWGGEFGRTSYSQGKLTATNYGRDHHPRCFTVWMAGGGVQAGVVHGTTDDFSYNIVDGGVHVHDFHATLLHLLGVEPRAADVLLPGPAVPPDRRAREGGAGAAGVANRGRDSLRRRRQSGSG
jgi:arylsulfatase A-like enzyme